jgi:hypothetical protein
MVSDVSPAFAGSFWALVPKAPNAAPVGPTGADLWRHASKTRLRRGAAGRLETPSLAHRTAATDIRHAIAALAPLCQAVRCGCGAVRWHMAIEWHGSGIAPLR